MSLSDSDQHVIAEARRLGPGLRASTSDRDRLAGWLLAELVTLAERLAAQDHGGIRWLSG